MKGKTIDFSREADSVGKQYESIVKKNKMI